MAIKSSGRHETVPTVYKMLPCTRSYQSPIRISLLDTLIDEYLHLR